MKLCTTDGNLDLAGSSLPVLSGRSGEHDPALADPDERWSDLAARPEARQDACLVAAAGG